MNEPTFNPYQPPRDDEPPAVVDRSIPRKPVTALRTTLLVLFGLAAVGVLADAYGVLRVGLALDDRELSEAQLQSELSWYEEYSVMIAGLGLWLRVATAVVWFVWLVRCNRNLRSLGFEHLEFGPAAVVWWWFVPLANLLLPFQIVRELWQGSHAVSQGQISLFGSTSTVIVAVWWLSFLLGRLASILVSGMMWSHELDEVLVGTNLAGVSLPLQLLAIGVAIKLTVELSRAQTQALARPASGVGPIGPASS